MKSTHLREFRQPAPDKWVTVSNSPQSIFSTSIHSHTEFELIYIKNAQGSTRIVGNDFYKINNEELVLIGSHLPHGWFRSPETTISAITKISIQFSPNIFNHQLLDSNGFQQLKKLIQKANQGISFSPKVIQKFAPRLLSLSKHRKHEVVFLIQSLLFELAMSNDYICLTNPVMPEQNATYFAHQRFDRLLQYLSENAYRPITLEEAAQHIHMTGNSLTRFIKQHCGQSFIELLHDIRIIQVKQRLLTSSQNIAEICFETGFQNISNFNRVFRQKTKMTPREFRKFFSSPITFSETHSPNHCLEELNAIQ